MKYIIMLIIFIIAYSLCYLATDNTSLKILSAFVILFLEIWLSGNYNIYKTDYLSYHWHIYKIFENETEGVFSYDDAVSFCEENGGHLAVINDEKENKKIYHYLRKNGLETAYFGYSDQEVEGYWNWCNNKSNNYENWSTEGYPYGQPNNGAGNSPSHQDEDYAEFYKVTDDGTWNDAEFGMNANCFICEWDNYILKFIQIMMGQE